MPSTVYETISWEPDGSDDGFNHYTPTADGYAVMKAPNDSNDKNINLRLSNKGIITASSGTGAYQSIYMPVVAGEKVYYDTSWLGSIGWMRFYYSIKSAKKLGLL